MLLDLERERKEERKKRRKRRETWNVLISLKELISVNVAFNTERRAHRYRRGIKVEIALFVRGAIFRKREEIFLRYMRNVLLYKMVQVCTHLINF